MNTNAVVTLDPDGREIIVTGAGIGFRKKRGELLDDALVDRIYRLESNEESRKLQEFVQAVSEKYLDIAEKVVQAARIEEGLKIKDTLYVTLTDHINSALDRHQAGIELKNMIRPDIQKFLSQGICCRAQGDSLDSRGDRCRTRCGRGRVHRYAYYRLRVGQ